MRKKILFLPNGNILAPTKYPNEGIANNLISFCLVLQIIDRFFSNIISNSTINDIGNRMYWPFTLIVFFLVLIKELLYLNFRIVDILFFLIICFDVIQFKEAQQSWIIGSFLIIFASRNLNFYKLIKTSIWTIFGCTLFSITGAIFGKFVPLRFISFVNGNSFTDFFGMIYFSYISHIVMFLTIGYCVVRKKKIKTLEIIFLWFINFIILINTQTFNPFLVVTIFLLGLPFFQKNIFLKLKEIVISLIPLFSFLILYLLIRMYGIGNHTAIYFNDLTSGRLSLAFGGINRFGIHLFSNLFQVYAHGYAGIVGATYSYIDSAYVLYLLRFGIIFFIVWIMMIIISIRNANGLNNVLPWAIAVISIHAIFDPEILWIEFNPFLVTLGLAFSAGRARFEYKI
ncbi:membrane hypothetical protein [Oenococcus oeni]|uniref:hypothetical protein n=1 Tax=Oenococcus oeni TaxID=1247 RepID=UPI0010B7BE23|nr:hypothetical protein [Oenococcus oeni]SYW05544.1 membrane hypothetical protein [Oenococcus oeni]